MLDLHCHLLPGLDDGPKILESSIEAIKKTLESDINGFFATPHYIRTSFPNKGKDIQEKIDLVKSKLPAEYQNYPIIKGAEVYLEENIHEDIANFDLTLANSHYVLVESNRIEFPSNLKDILYQIVRNGYTPILAHPERYQEVIRSPEIVEDFMFRDTLIQLNIGSLNGLYGKKSMTTAWKLLEKGFVHFLATDNHGQSHHKSLQRALDLVASRFDKYTVDLLTKINPQKVLDDKNIEVFYLETVTQQKENFFTSISKFFKKGEKRK